jgi:hypothetical protein
MGGLHEMEEPRAAVGRMWVPFDQTPGLQLVEDATKRDRLDFEKLCESRLIDALVLPEVGQDLPLRSGQPATARVLLKSLSEQTSDLVQQESECG